MYKLISCQLLFQHSLYYRHSKIGEIRCVTKRGKRKLTGGGPEKPSELKDIELRALGLWGNIVLTGVSKSNAEVGFGPPPPSNTEEVFIANSWGFIAAADDEIVEEDSVITDGNVHSAQPSEILTSCEVVHELLTPSSTSGVGRTTRKRKKEMSVTRDAQLSDAMTSVEKGKTAAIQNVANQLERLADIKEAEVVEIRRRTDTLSNIADAIKMLARANNKNI